MNLAPQHRPRAAVLRQRISLIMETPLLFAAPMPASLRIDRPTWMFPDGSSRIGRRQFVVFSTTRSRILDALSVTAALACSLGLRHQAGKKKANR